MQHTFMASLAPPPPGRLSRHAVIAPDLLARRCGAAAPRDAQPAGGAYHETELAETAEETHVRWREWSAFALTGSSLSCSSDDISDDEGPPQRYPRELAATERFLAADLRRRVCEAQAEMPLTIEEKIALPAWMSWGRGSAALQGGGRSNGGEDYSLAAAAPALCKMNGDTTLCAALVAATRTEHDVASPERGLLRRGMRKVAKRLPNLRIMASAALSAPTLRLPTVSAFARSRGSPKAWCCADSSVVSHGCELSA